MTKFKFLPRIEALRGVAALSVAVHHVAVHFDDVPRANEADNLAFQMLRGSSNGTGAVVAFFVISGFVLSRSLAANDDPVRFFRNRILRLLPAAIFAVALLSALTISSAFTSATRAHLNRSISY